MSLKLEQTNPVIEKSKTTCIIFNKDNLNSDLETFGKYFANR